jgi:hypothetical protein
VAESSLPLLVFVIEHLKFVDLVLLYLGLGIVGYACGMKNFVGGTKSLEGSRCIA